MKKNFLLVLLLLAAFGCQKTAIVEDVQDSSELTVIASLKSDATKTLLTDAGIGRSIKASWLSTDEIGVYGFRHEGSNPTKFVNIGNNSRFDSTGEGALVTFSLNQSDKKLNWIYQGYNHTFYAYYPYSASAGDDYTSVPFTVPSYQTQKAAGNTEHIAPYDLLYASADAMWNGNNGTNINKEIEFSFNHALSVFAISLSSSYENQSLSRLRFSFSDETEKLSVTKGSLNLATGQIDVQEGGNEIVLDVVPSVKLSSEPSTFYMIATPGHASKEYSVYATINGKEIQLAKKNINSKGISVSVKSELSLVQNEEVAPDKYVDLSESGTANCYLISTPGDYKFNASVKGNGNVAEGLASVVSAEKMAPKSALVLWYNTIQTSNNWVDASPVAVESVSVGPDGFVRFSTPEAFVSGNVVIATFAEEGVTYDSITADENKCINNATLLWSWNIWAAEGYDPETSTITAGGKQFMNRLLGATVSGMGTTGDYIPVGAVGNYYQWGRKDPFPAFSDYAVTIPTQYTNILFGTPTYTPIKALKIDGQSSKMNLDGQMFGYRTNESGSLDSGNAWNLMKRDDISSDKSTKNKVYVDYATVHPYKCITNNGNTFGGWRTWLNGDDPSYKSLWGESDLKKTLFDPCPAGWRVPSKDEATEFVNLAKAGNLASNLHGMEFQGNYFPITSSRDCAHFGTSYVLSVGVPVGSVFWTSDITGNYSYVYAASLNAPANFSDKYKKGEAIELESKVEAQNNANGNCVRCVKE